MKKPTCNPEAEICGATMLGMIQHMQTPEIAPIIRAYGYENIDPNHWYPLQKFLNFLAELTVHPNIMANLVLMGMSIGDIAPFPIDVTGLSFGEVVEAWNQQYQANFRNAQAGQRTITKLNDHHYTIEFVNNLMPDDLEYGVLYGFTRRFLPKGTDVTVWYDEDVPRRDEGGNRTILHVTWE